MTSLFTQLIVSYNKNTTNYILYKMKIWRRVYFGSLANYKNPPN